MVIIAVILHNTLGLLGGYWGGRLFGFDESNLVERWRSKSGMQNSGLAAALGKIYFGPLAALPGRAVSQCGTTFQGHYWLVTGPGNRLVEKIGRNGKGKLKYCRVAQAYPAYTLSARCVLP
ncbi:membrane transport protein [Salmonella enterica subsp. enterica]|uniref:Membrane transport protein n=1 Tax=Salmonella enterica I TaxID=59201 RepID=A0A447TQ64_SALET|nr:membrane transport protein [Salmonella enterica subsp. enterica]